MNTTNTAPAVKHTKHKSDSKPSLFEDMNNHEAFDLLQEVRDDKALEPYFKMTLKHRTDVRVKVSGELNRRDIQLFIAADLVEAIYYSNGGNAYHYYMHEKVYTAVFAALVAHNLNPDYIKYRQLLAKLHDQFAEDDGAVFGVTAMDFNQFMRDNQFDVHRFLEWAEKSGHYQKRVMRTVTGRDITYSMHNMRINGSVVKAYRFTMTPGVQ